MKDTELRARLIKLGMQPTAADNVTREIRDRTLPVAAVAALKVAQHRGRHGMAGYGDEQLAGLLKKVKKAVKKVVKVAGKAAAVVAPVIPIAAVAAGAAHLLTKKKKKQAAIAVPAPVAQQATVVAQQAVAENYPADPAQLMMAMLANQGTNMVSPPAQQLMQDVVSQGVEQTPAGPSPLPPWLIPAGVGVAALVGVLALSRGKR
jgi:hypothetical protein